MRDLCHAGRAPRVRGALYLSAGAVWLALLVWLVTGAPTLASPAGAPLQANLPVVTGTVLLQGRPVDCSPSKAVTLDIGFIDPADYSMRFPVTYTTRADACGVFTVTNVEAKTYNVLVKGEHTLSVYRENVNLTVEQPFFTTPFGPLAEGDINGDDRVDSADRTLLTQSYWSASGEARHNPLADLNEGDYVDALDASLLSLNDGATGATLSGVAVPQAAWPTLRVSGPSELVRGQTALLTITMEDAASIGAADVYLAYDPAVLMVVNDAGQPVSAVTPDTTSLDYVITNTVDATNGVIAYAALRTADSPGGDGTLFRVRVKSRIATGPAGTNVVFRSHAPSRQMTRLASGGYDELTGTTSLNLVILPPHTVHVPIILRQWTAYLAGATEVEPNNTVAQANGRLRSGVAYTGAFPTSADPQDYFFVEMSASHTIEVWLSGIPSGVNADLQLFDGSLASRGYSGNLGNADEHILTASLPPGRYYVQVYRRSGSSSQPYSLRVVFE
ncbi:MAG: pre-peptidase C-terminal domain-containing protein [Anaerolineae bacterium]